MAALADCSGVETSHDFRVHILEKDRLSVVVDRTSNILVQHTVKFPGDKLGRHWQCSETCSTLC